jgi:uncharacterized membrane protein YccF (DUF307 family)
MLFGAGAAVALVLIGGCVRGGQSERAALGVPAYGPSIAGVDDGAAERADAVERRGQVGDGEVRKGSGVAGARSSLVDSEAQVVSVDMPPRSGGSGPWREGDPEDSVPEPPGAFGIVGREFDEWGGHGRKVWPAVRARVCLGARAVAGSSPRGAVLADRCGEKSREPHRVGVPPDRVPRSRGAARLALVRLLGNIIWFVFAGLWLFIGYAFAALLCFIFIITIPFGVASLRIALYGVWPFGRAVVPQASKSIGSTLGNVIWFLIAGWWLTILHIVTGVVLCLTIIGIPLGLANFKLITVGLRPFGREIVSVEEARRRGVRAAVVPTPTG